MRAVDTVVIGAGQAGLALSHCLSRAGVAHVVLERGRVGERWRSQRWDSLTLLTPNWLNGLPGAGAFADPDGFASRAAVIAYLSAYAASAPVIEGTTVLRVQPAGRGYLVHTSGGDWYARHVVVATGDCDVPRVPAVAAAAPAFLHQLHASAYRNPDALPDGDVLVVGAGPSGQQLAVELLRAGRRVVLAVGRHARMPRRYRGRDVFAWLTDIGQLDTHVSEVGDLAAARRAPSFPVSGAGGGETLGLDRVAALGGLVTGRLEGFAGSHALFGDNLHRDERDADRRMRRTLAAIDAHAGSPAPDSPPPVVLGAGPASLDLAGSVRAVIWATGYRRAYPWLHVGVLDGGGEIVQREGVTAAPGLFTLGLRFQRTRRSHFLGGVGADAELIAQRIAGGAAWRQARAA